MSSDDDLSVILFMVLGTASAIAAAAGGFFGTRAQKCQAEFTPWSPCTDECDVVPTRSRTYVITSGASECPYIDGYTETEICDELTPCCELVRDWENPLDVPCVDGVKEFTRELKENKPGACDNFETEKYTTCCTIMSEDWEPFQGCGAIQAGKQKYIKYTAGPCPLSEREKFEDCAPCVEGWDKDIPTACPATAQKCDYAGESWTKTWKITRPSVDTGDACTKNDGETETFTCPPTDPCCTYSDWTYGSCDENGKKKNTRTITNEPCRPSPNVDVDNELEYEEDCCYEAGDWTPAGQCGEEREGLQKQVQTTAGPCPDGTNTQYVPCCGYTEWTPSGSCIDSTVLDFSVFAPSGKRQKIVREVNTTEGCAREQVEVLSDYVPCCGYTEWQPSGACTDSTLLDFTVFEPAFGELQRIERQLGDVEGCYPEEETILSEYVPCCGYTDWTPSGQCTDEGQLITREVGTTIPGCYAEQQQSLSTTVPCCGYTEWALGPCIKSTDAATQPSRTDTRDRGSTPDCFPEQTEYLSKDVSCCYEDDWAPVTGTYCTLDQNDNVYKQQYQRSVFGSACDETNNPTTKYEACETLEQCPGSWDEHKDGLPDCPAAGVCTDGITYTRSWDKEKAPAGYVYSNCPADDTKTCPAVPCDCVQGWDTSQCPTQAGFLGNDPSKQKTWRVTSAATGTGTCISDYEDGQTRPCDATALEQKDCVGSWDEHKDGLPDCYCGTDEVTYSRNWTTSPAPAGQTYINCPPPSESKTCPKVDCATPDDDDGLSTLEIAAIVAGTAATICSYRPEWCMDNMLNPSADVNCVGKWTNELPAECPCGLTQPTTYTTTYKHIVKKQNNGKECEYQHDTVKNKYCNPTLPCCQYSGSCTGGLFGTYSYTKINEPCQEDGAPPEPVPCQNCLGSYESCPTGCGFQGGLTSLNFITIVPPDSLGNKCPASTTVVDCPPTPSLI